jgi:hypothetical protein
MDNDNIVQFNPRPPDPRLARLASAITEYLEGPVLKEVFSAFPALSH